MKDQLSYMTPGSPFVGKLKTHERTIEEVRHSVDEKRAKNDLLKKLNSAIEKQIREVQIERIILENRICVK